MHKDSLAKIPGLLDALLQVIDDWRDVEIPKEHSRACRARTLGTNYVVTGFGDEFEALGSNDSLKHHGTVSGFSGNDASVKKNAAKVRSKEWWYEEDAFLIWTRRRSSSVQWLLQIS